LMGGILVSVFTLLGAAFLMIPDTICINGLNTLGDAAFYATAMPELPPMENTNMVRPEYDAFYRAHKPGLLMRKWRALLCLLGGHTRFTWSPVYFKALLEASLLRLQQHKIEKNIVFKIAPTPSARIVVVGALYGAYHSMVRTLKKLEELKIINDSLKVIAPNTYVVILGSAISRSSYGAETLGLLLKLLEMNLDSVIYLRGNHEDNKYWEAFGLKEQLAVSYGSEVEAVAGLVNNIFIRLPLGLYVAIPGKADHFVKFSYLSSDESTKLKEEAYAHFLSAPQAGPLDRHEITQTVTHNNAVKIDVGFHGEKKRQTFQASTGLRLLPADGGCTAWTLFSSPTLVNQKGFNFKCDAFAVIDVGGSENDWKITEYSQDALKVDGYKTTEYQFFTGTLWDAKKAEKPALAAPGDLEKKSAQETAVEDVYKTMVASAAKSPFVQMLSGALRRKRLHPNKVAKNDPCFQKPLMPAKPVPHSAS